MPDLPRSVGYEVVVPLRSGADRRIRNYLFELERVYSPRCARRLRLVIDGLTGSSIGPLPCHSAFQLLSHQSKDTALSSSKSVG